MLFVVIMSKKKIYLYASLIALTFFFWLFSSSNENNDDFPETVKIALREVGNQLLLSNQDSTSLVLPIIEVEKFKYKLSFQKQFSFEPSFLVSEVKKSFQKSLLPNHYRVEVIQCSDEEVAYSYEVKNQRERDIIPCGGRFLPNNCYTIEVKFTNKTILLLTKKVSFFLLLIMLLILFIDYQSIRKKRGITRDNKTKPTKLGSFHFYPDQNKLVKKASEISLSKKECELLAIFVARPNEIIKRDELTKKVWEDNGVFVGRSLDTYISKLRKKLKEDASIKLTNIHGVGYKLEISNRSF